ncbi:pyridoxamine 5'-phosphate oxidase family protein [Nonlabens ponticola]|uniref:Pyridoxamine 5'-phosphate oxidase Alr4036 family FMN-binding domain-containing protein n=1 Tax=Nonlabens ponticola TaxID=2496866 RepID=A0A3S9MXK6_9FLAO|nr:pyridoxamine 5'-phosphate oxidase family protein [Nonlabens ponticola]AZQ44006.1 hypothetical protein EJ995_07075 [Nonlabens ponticola]
MREDLQEFFDKVVTELRTGMVKRGHPYKYVTLATIDSKNSPVLRTVVLRQITQDLIGTIYTDSRSNKVVHIETNSSASILAYHKGKKLQVSLSGTLMKIEDQEHIKALFHKVNPNALKDYTTATAPGSTIGDPSQVTYNPRLLNYFQPLEFVTSFIEVLQLQDPLHHRARFVKQPDGSWNGDWLTP